MISRPGCSLDSNYSNPAYPATGAVCTDPCNGSTYQQWNYLETSAFLGEPSISAFAAEPRPRATGVKG